MERDPLDSTKLAADRRAFGEKLKELRLRQGATHESLAQSTRIRTTLLLALEAGDFDHLPGEIFVRGFVRSLAKELDSDPEALVAELAGCWAKHPAREQPMDAATVQAAAAAIASASAAAAKQKKRARAPAPGASAATADNDGSGGTTAGLSRTREDSTLSGVYRMMGALIVVGAVALGARWAWDKQQQRGTVTTVAGPAARIAPPATSPVIVPADSVEDDPVEAARIAAAEAAGRVPAETHAVVPQAAPGAVPSEVQVTEVTQIPVVDETAPAEAAKLEAEKGAAAKLEAEDVAAKLEAEDVAAAKLEAEKGTAAKLEAEKVAAAKLEAEKAASAIPTPVPVASSAAPEAAATAAPAVGAAEGKLEITATKATRIRLALDTANATERELTAETHVFSFTERADLLVLDAGAVKVSFNGRPLGDLGAAGRVRRLSFRTGSPEPLPAGSPGKSSLSARDPAQAKDQKM